MRAIVVRNQTRLFLPLFFSAALLAVGCQGNKTKQAAPASAQNSWPEKMQSMSKRVQTLIPFVYSRQAFHDPKNQEIIKKEVESFAAAIHEVPEKAGQQMMGDDPIAKFTLGRLRDDVSRAQRSYQAGHKEYARSILRGAVGHCFSCHSRTQLGPEFSLLPSTFEGARLDATEKADLFVATRQYDKALMVLSEQLNSPVTFDEDPYEQERALKKYLAISVRLKNDPTSAINTIQKFLDRKNVPFYLAEDARGWQKALKDWMKERPSKKNAVARAEELIKDAKRLQSVHSYQTGNVEYLRASALLHEELPRAQDPKMRAKIYYLLGSSYEILSDLGFWNVPEVYFEACIREVPKTELAKTCYKDFERNIVFGFSGSAGIFIPKEERDRLKQLKGTAGFAEPAR